MQKVLLFTVIVFILGSFAVSMGAAQECGMTSRLQPMEAARVISPTLNVRAFYNVEAAKLGELRAGDVIRVYGGPTCIGGIHWWSINFEGQRAYIAEESGGQYLVEPVEYVPTPTPALNIPELKPVAPPSNVPLPPVIPIEQRQAANGFVIWNWPVEAPNGGPNALDPYTIVPPEVYAGDMPELPIDLDRVRFVGEAGLTNEQLTLLAQNGFVVVPGNLRQMDDAYQSLSDFTWLAPDGYSYFITTDTMLHSFYLAFENLLSLLEQTSLYAELSNALTRSYRAAELQAKAAVGTALESQTRGVAVYYAVALQLLDPRGDESAEDAVSQSIVTALQNADSSILSEAQPITEMVIAAQGTLPVPFLEEYIEDFSGYQPRGHYTSSAQLSRYFRAMTWLSRITFRSRSDFETQQALLALRALQSDAQAFESWRRIYDTLTFLIGPVDNLGPVDYSPLVSRVYGELTLESMADEDKLRDFEFLLSAQSGPRINSLLLPPDTLASELESAGRGFRWLGQRYTLDANALQQLMAPYVSGRGLPTGLDVAAALGSNSAYELVADTGLGDFPQYQPQVVKLRQEINDLTVEDWTRNIYSTWLWALQPYWVRNAESYPPLMNTEAWLRKDLQTSLASYTELKHATILYGAFPGGLGGGGEDLPDTYGYVEPNPLVFARVAIMAQTLHDGLLERGLIPEPAEDSLIGGLRAVHEELLVIASTSAYLAELAQKELQGEEFTRQDHDYVQYAFGRALFYIRVDIQQWQADPPENLALVADIVGNPAAGRTLANAVGLADYMYVVIPTPDGLQLARGGVLSYYEFTTDINQRPTDEAWREDALAGNVPPRPFWVNIFFSE